MKIIFKDVDTRETVEIPRDRQEDVIFFLDKNSVGSYVLQEFFIRIKLVSTKHASIVKDALDFCFDYVKRTNLSTAVESLYRLCEFSADQVLMFVAAVNVYNGNIEKAVDAVELDDVWTFKSIEDFLDFLNEDQNRYMLNGRLYESMIIREHNLQIIDKLYYYVEQ